jgi:hypothetical protein
LEGALELRQFRRSLLGDEDQLATLKLSMVIRAGGACSQAGANTSGAELETSNGLPSASQLDISSSLPA